MNFPFGEGLIYMRVWQRWVFSCCLIGGAGIFGAVIANTRAVHRSFTISFVGYTNLPNKSVRSALFDFHDENKPPRDVGDIWVEVGKLEGHRISGTFERGRLITVPDSESGHSFLYAVDVPFDVRGWSASCEVYNPGIRMRLLNYAAKHHLLPKDWLELLRNHAESSGWVNIVTYSSRSITNSPSTQNEP